MENETKETVDPKADETQDSDIDIRSHKAFLAVTKQLNDERAARQRMEQEQADRQRLHDEEVMKSKGEWEKLSQIARDREAKIVAEYAEKERLLSLKMGLSFIKDDLALEGAIAKCPKDKDVSEYVEELRKARPDLWDPTSFQKSNGVAQGARSTNQPVNDWEKVIRDMDSSDWAVQEAAINKIGRYRKEKGEYPPGYIPRKR